jgi:hypothetical protein
MTAIRSADASPRSGSPRDPHGQPSAGTVGRVNPKAEGRSPSGRASGVEAAGRPRFPTHIAAERASAARPGRLGGCLAPAALLGSLRACGPWLKSGGFDGVSGGAWPQQSGGCSPRDWYMRHCPQSWSWGPDRPRGEPITGAPASGLAQGLVGAAHPTRNCALVTNSSQACPSGPISPASRRDPHHGQAVVIRRQEGYPAIAPSDPDRTLA